MRTILHLIDTTGPGGAETVFVNLADRVRDHGYQSLAIIRGKGWVYDALQKRQVPTEIVDTRGRFNWRFIHKLIDVVKSQQVDLIQTHLLGSNVYGALVGRLTATPVIGTFHGMVDISPDERFTAAKLWLMKQGIRRFITVSQSLAEAIEARQLLDRRKTQVIYNGIELERYGKSDSLALRQQLALPGDALVAGCLGNVRPAKAYDMLIRAVASLQARYPNLHVVVAGHQKPALMSELEKLMAELQIAANVHFIGFHEDSARFLSQLDMFVLSSSSEGFSISTVEAMATGLPVIATRCGGPEEIIRDQQDGILVEAGNPEALATAMARVIDDPAFSGKIAAEGIISARQKFSDTVMLKKYLDLYAEYIS